MSKSKRNSALGEYGERVAERYLTERGMILLDRNWRHRHGELDLVLRDGEVLVVCEVKTRSTTDFGHPLEAVTAEKLMRLRLLAELWMSEHQIAPDGIRIDVVGVLRPARGAPSIEHVEGIG